ncbi:hypothetical protein [Aquabacterium sp. A08]|uniref:hypothetical protein n=1 Tax=Aquabacterium sp. A08 TaxID=2718532 RepID=UPI001AAE43E6|nr:hypothetical protein [Aquabacterium sp. A08]
MALMALCSAGLARECRPPDDTRVTTYYQRLEGRVDPLRCDSLVTVLKKLVSRHRIGGRQLEPEQSLSPERAALEWQQAQQDPQLAGELAQLSREPDAVNRLLLEAVLLDAHGYYAARDARLLQLPPAGGR